MKLTCMYGGQEIECCGFSESMYVLQGTGSEAVSLCMALYMNVGI